MLEYNLRKEGEGGAYAVSVLMTICLFFGGILMRKGKEEEDRRERNRQRHRDKVSKGGK